MSARPIVPSACRWDGIPEREHARQWVAPSKGGPGWHMYVRPTDAQVLERMRARRLARLESLRLRLPVDDRDRHALDGDADERFAALAMDPAARVSTPADYPGWVPPHVYPSTCNPVDYAASTAAGYNPPVVWEDPAPTRQVQEDVVRLLGLPEPTQPERPVAVVPVVGEVL